MGQVIGRMLTHHGRHTHSMAGARPVLGREEIDHLIEDQNRVYDPPTALIWQVGETVFRQIPSDRTGQN
jgi:hypothetical protein